MFHSLFIIIHFIFFIIIISPFIIPLLLLLRFVLPTTLADEDINKINKECKCSPYYSVLEEEEEEVNEGVE